MRARCENKKDISYHRYGAKGIEVCEEWKEDKTKFFAWAFENGYKDHLTLDRIDGTKGYSPENCRWVTVKDQANNRVNNRYLEAFGKRKTLAQWADYTGIDLSTIWSRLKRGWDIDRTLTEPVQKQRRKNNDDTGTDSIKVS